MVIPTIPNTISLNNINLELGNASGTAISLNEGDVRRLAKGVAQYYVHTPVSGTAISLSEVSGKDVGGRAEFTTSGNFTIPLCATLTVDVRGAGGGGGGGGSEIYWFNQAGNRTRSTRFGDGGSSGTRSIFGPANAPYLIGNGGTGGAGGRPLNSPSTTHDGTGGTGEGGTTVQGGGSAGGTAGSGAYAYWEGGAGGAGGRAYTTWNRGVFAPGSTVSFTIGSGGTGGAEGPDGSPYQNATYLDTYRPGSPGGNGTGGIIIFTWT